MGLRTLGVGDILADPTTLLILGRLETLPIEEIQMWASFDYLRDFKPKDFLPMNAALTRFRSLKRLRFEYDGKFAPKKIEERVLEAFTFLSETNVVLHFEKLY